MLDTLQPAVPGRDTHRDTHHDTHHDTVHSRRWWALAVLCLSALLVVVDNTIVNVALPTFSRDLGASTSGLQWIVDSYTLVFAGLLLFGGGLGDRFGRKLLLQIGLVLFGVTSLWACLAATTGQLVAARAGMGVAAAVIYPATLALLSTVFTDRRERATAIGIWTAVSGIAVAVGPLAGGALLSSYSWHSVFLINLPMVALALICGWHLLPDSREVAPGRFDVLGAALSVAAVGLGVWTVIEAPGRGWLSPGTAGSAAGALVLLAAFGVTELRTANPLLDVRIFRNARVSAACGAIATAFFALFGFIFLITQYLQAVRGYGTMRAGVATLPFALTVACTSPLAIMLAKRWGAKLVVAGGLLSMSAGFALACTVEADSAYWSSIVPAMILMAAGLALTTSPSTEAIMANLKADQLGAGSAINDTAREVGGALGVAVLGSVMNSVYGSSVADRFTALKLPAAAVDAARESVMGALTVADRLPPAAATVAAAARDAARQTFVDGLHAGCLAAAIAAAIAAVAALVLLPGHDDSPSS